MSLFNYLGPSLSYTKLKKKEKRSSKEERGGGAFIDIASHSAIYRSVIFTAKPKQIGRASCRERV